MGYASILLARVWAATATMEIRFRARVPYDAPLPPVAGVTDARALTARWRDRATMACPARRR
jgi:hypothetical protein